MKKKKGVSKELSIGIFVVVVLVIGYFGFNFLKNRNVFGGDYILNATFNNANGLEKGSSVTINGYKIGSVEDVILNLATQTLDVELNIEGKYDIPNNSTAAITSASLLGGKVVAIEIGTVGGETLKGGDQIKTTTKEDLVTMATSKFSAISDSLNNIMGKFVITLNGVNGVLNDENVAALSGTFANLEGISKDIDRITSSQGANIESTLENLHELTATLNAAAPDLERSLANIAVMSDSLAVSAPTLVANATKAVDELQGILTQINSGEGTANKLLTDQELYTNITTALANLAILLDDIQENPKKYINVSVF